MIMEFEHDMHVGRELHCHVAFVVPVTSCLDFILQINIQEAVFTHQHPNQQLPYKMAKEPFRDMLGMKWLVLGCFFCNQDGKTTDFFGQTLPVRVYLFRDVRPPPCEKPGCTMTHSWKA